MPGVLMKERGWIEPIVERVVGQVLDSHAAQLRAEIVRRVMEEIAAAPATADHGAASASGPADLARAVAEIQVGTSQREILRSLLDTSARHAARVALFVVKGSHATGWQARGFANSDAVKDFALDENAPAVGHAIRDRVVASATVADLDSRFLKEFGAPASGAARILPLILKDKVAALVYADSAEGTVRGPYGQSSRGQSQHPGGGADGIGLQRSLRLACSWPWHGSGSVGRRTRVARRQRRICGSNPNSNDDLKLDRRGSLRSG